MSYSHFEDQFLVAAYLIAEENEIDQVPVKNILDQFILVYSPNWVGRAIRSLIESGYSEDFRHIGPDIEQDLFLTPRAYKRGEELTNYIELQRKEPAVEPGAKEQISSAAVSPSRASDSGIPASDRIVNLDHNSASVRQAVAAAELLVKQLKETNDLGGLSAEASQVAIVEVEQIASDLKQRAVRMPAFGERAKSTLSWIGREAAGALVGAAALGLLALLANLLGFGF